MSIEENQDAEIEVEANDARQPELLDFMIRASRCYTEWAVVIGLAFIVVAGVSSLKGDIATPLPMLSVGMFSVITGYVSGAVAGVLEENISPVTEDVTLSV